MKKQNKINHNKKEKRKWLPCKKRLKTANAVSYNQLILVCQVTLIHPWVSTLRTTEIIPFITLSFLNVYDICNQEPITNVAH